MRNHLLRKKEDNPQVDLKPDDVREILVEAVAKGPPEVAAEADRLLTNQGWSKVGDASPKAVLSDFKWEQGIGHAFLTYGGSKWQALDYGDKLPISERLQDLLGEDHGAIQETEIRQCLLLHCTAGVLAARKSKSQRPVVPLKEVQEATGEIRYETAVKALQAMEHLGEPTPEVGRSEADVRTFVHDFTRYHHDKDYRCLAAFPPKAYEDVSLNIVRMDLNGGLTVEVIEGCQCRTSPTQVWLLVSKGHMKLLRRPEEALDPPVVREVVAAGWEVHLEAVQGPEARVRARDLAKCPRCQESYAEERRTGDRPSPVLGLYPLDAMWTKTGAEPPKPVETKDMPPGTKFTDEEIREWLGDQAPIYDRAKKEGLDLLEVYAGSARVTTTVKDLGGTALPIGLAHGHDLGRARDRAMVLCLVKTLQPRHALLRGPDSRRLSATATEKLALKREGFISVFPWRWPARRVRLEDTRIWRTR